MTSTMKAEIVDHIRRRRRENASIATIRSELREKYPEVSADDVADAYLTFEELSIAPGAGQYTLTIQQLRGGDYLVWAYGSGGSMPLKRNFSLNQVEREFGIIMTPLDFASLKERIEANKGHAIRVLNNNSDVYPDIVRMLQLK